METLENKEETHRITASGDLEVSTYLEIAKESQGERPFNESKSAIERETAVILDFGSQYSMLIARRVRECHVYCELLSYDTPWEKIKSLNPKAFIFSGGPTSVYEKGAPLAPPAVYESGIPILGICYGMQAIAYQLGGGVHPSARQEYGHAILHQGRESPIFADLPTSFPVWMSHGDAISKLPPGFTSLAYTENSPIAVMGNNKGILGIQFHPEAILTEQGKELLKNFIRITKVFYRKRRTN